MPIGVGEVSLKNLGAAKGCLVTKKTLVFGLPVIVEGRPGSLVTAVAASLESVQGKRVIGTTGDNCFRCLVDGDGGLAPGRSDLHLGEESGLLEPPALADLDVLVDVRQGRGYIGPKPPLRKVTETPATTAFLWSLQEVLKSYGVFYTHAAAVARSGSGVLISGRSGSGKSTAALALVEAGFRLLSDDVTFLFSGPKGMELLPFPQPVGAWPEPLRPGPGGPEAATAGSKRWLPVASVYQDVTPAQARALTFVSSGKSPEFSPVAPIDAFAELIKTSIVPLDSGLSRAHTNVLAALVRSAPAYRFCLGKDPAVAARLVAGRLTRHLEWSC